MTEQLISLETAKLAKEKGFDWKVFYHYSESPVNDLEILCEPDDPQVGQGWILENYNDSNYYLTKYSTPTQSLLQKWLREVHKIHVRIDIQDTDWYFGLDSIGSEFEYKSQCEPSFKSHEEALEEGLLEALKLL